MSRYLAKLAFAILLVMAASPLFGQDGVRGALADANALGTWAGATDNGHVALADFDGDHRLDGAVLVHSPATGANDYRINLHLSTDPNRAVTFTSAELLLRVAAIDINGDGDVDVVVERPFSHERLFVWLNDGHGHFVPSQVHKYAQSNSPSENFQNTPFDPPNVLSCESTQRFAERGLATSDLLPAPRAPSVRIGGYQFITLPRHLSSALPSRAPPRNIQL